MAGRLYEGARAYTSSGARGHRAMGCEWRTERSGARSYLSASANRVRRMRRGIGSAGSTAVLPKVVGAPNLPSFRVRIGGGGLKRIETRGVFC